MLMRNESRNEASDRLLVDAREAARLLGISPRTLWTLTDGGRIKAVRIGRLVKYDPRDLLAFIDASKS